MTITDPTLDRIKTDLVSGIETHQRRRSRRRIAATIPVLGLIIGTGLVLASADDNPAYALTERADGTIRVEVFPDFDDVDALRAELQDAGLDAAIVQLRAPPSLEGVVEVSSHDNEASGAIEFDDAEFVIDTGDIEGEIEILIYSPTAAGDTYGVSPSIFAPDQPLAGLHCAYTNNAMPTGELEVRALEAGVTNFVWMVFGEIDEDGSVEVTNSDERPDGVVTGAQMQDPDTLQVSVTPTSDQPAATAISMNDGTHYRVVPTCTDDLAARWE